MDRRTFVKGTFSLPLLLSRPAHSLGDSLSANLSETLPLEGMNESTITNNCFRGSFSGFVDQKDRIKIPGRFAEILKSQCNRHLVMYSADCEIRCYPTNTWHEIEKQLVTGEPGSAMDKLKRMICNRTYHCRIDKMGCIQIPKKFIVENKIKHSVIYSGLLNCFAIMDSAVYEYENSIMEEALNSVDVLELSASLGL
jgi:division/cell wall cluster transcriptional repressor MraZ